MKISCIFCNHVTSRLEELRAHSATCEKHPAVIRYTALEKERDAWKGAAKREADLSANYEELIFPDLGIHKPDGFNLHVMYSARCMKCGESPEGGDYLAFTDTEGAVYDAECAEWQIEFRYEEVEGNRECSGVAFLCCTCQRHCIECGETEEIDGAQFAEVPDGPDGPLCPACAGDAETAAKSGDPT